MFSVGLAARWESQVLEAPGCPSPPAATHATPCALHRPGTQGDLNGTKNGQQACPRHTPSARLAGQHPLEDTRPERRPHRHGPCPNERGAEWAPCGTGCVCLGEGAGIRDLSSRKAEHRWPHAPVTLGPSCALEGGCSAGARRSRDRSQVQTPRDRSPPPH